MSTEYTKIEGRNGKKIQTEPGIEKEGEERENYKLFTKQDERLK